MYPWRPLLLISSVVLCGLNAGYVLAKDYHTVAVASNLRPVLNQLVAEYNQRHSDQFRLASASSGQLSQQIIRGAPYALLLAADPIAINAVTAAKLTAEPAQPLLLGKLALLRAQHATWPIDQGLSGLQYALANAQIQRFAIANPKHAPYGRAALEVLRRLGLHMTIKPHLLIAESAGQAFYYVRHGADGGFVPLSLLVHAGVNRAHYQIVPTDLYQPLTQTAVVLQHAPAAGRRFLQFLRQPAAYSLFKQYGFVVIASEPDTLTPSN